MKFKEQQNDYLLEIKKTLFKYLPELENEDIIYDLTPKGEKAVWDINCKSAIYCFL